MSSLIEYFNKEFYNATYHISSGGAVPGGGFFLYVRYML